MHDLMTADKHDSQQTDAVTSLQTEGSRPKTPGHLISCLAEPRPYRGRSAFCYCFFWASFRKCIREQEAFLMVQRFALLVSIVMPSSVSQV